MRNFRKLKELSDYENLEEPQIIAGEWDTPLPPVENLYILRMLVRAKYGDWKIPPVLGFLSRIIMVASEHDREQHGVRDSWCYVTVRHGRIKSATDDEFHFDGSSFRTDIIPERNYIWVNHSPTEYKVGKLSFPDGFDPVKYNLFAFAAESLRDAPVQTCRSGNWYVLSPFCLHRRPAATASGSRTFYRLCFTDIEARDKNNTQNPLLPTDAYGRDPVRTFRDRLARWA